MNAQSLFKIVAKMGGMKFFPSDVDARLGIAEAMADICHTEEQAAWLAKRMTQLFTTGWPGVGELRAIASSKFRPADGIEAYSAVYLDGVPSEREQLPALAGTPLKHLASGEPVSASPSIQSTVAALVRDKDMNRVLAGMPRPDIPDIPVAQISDANRITPEMIDAEAKRHRELKATWGRCEACYLPHDPNDRCGEGPLRRSPQADGDVGREARWTPLK